MSFRLDAIGSRGPEHRYVVTDDARLRYAAATDDVPGGPVFAIVPVWETIALASTSVATEDARRRVVLVTTRVWQVDGAYGFESVNVEGSR